MTISDSAATAVVTANATTVTTASFTPTANTLLVALACMGNGATAASSLGTVTDTAGSTWTRLAGEASTGGGVAEVWVADAGASPSARTVTYDPGGSGASGLMLAVRQLSGAATRANQSGATAVNGGTATPSKAITTTTPGSLVVGSYATASNSYTLTANASTTLIAQVNGTGGDTAATYKAAALTTTPGSVTIGFSTTTTGAVNRMALVEILPSNLSLARSASDNAGGTDAATRGLGLATRTAADNAGGNTDRANIGWTRTAADNAGGGSDTVSIRKGRAAFDVAAGSVDTAVRAPLARSRAVTDAAGGASDSLAFFTLRVGAAPVLANPNWPVLGIDVDFTLTAGPPNTPTTRNSLNAAAYRRLITRRINIRRGRTYELDQVQTGECALEIPDPLEQLNPDNTGSFYNDGSTNGLLPYRPFQVWGMYPNQPGSGNILGYVPTGTDPGFATGVGHFEGTVSGTGTLANSTAQAHSGTHSMLVTQAGNGQAFGAYMQKAIRTAPGITYCFSTYVYATGGATVTVAVVDASGTVHVGSSSSVQNTWKRILVPWTPLDTQEQVIVYGSGVATPTFYVDDYQLEFGSTAGTFTESGPEVQELFTGYVERFPTSYDMAGTRAQRPLTAIDALGMLALISIRQSYARTVQADAPLVLMNMDDASGPPLVAGRTPTSGLTAVGGSGTISFAGDTLPDGSPAVSLTQVPTDSTAGGGTTLSSASAVGATSISVAASIAVGSYIVIDKGNAGEEWCYVTSTTGAGPFTLGVTRKRLALVALKTAHASGVSVTPQDQTTSYVTTRPEQIIPANFAGFTLEFWAKPVIGNVNMVAGENISGAPTVMPLASAGTSKRDTFIGLQADANALHLVLNDAGNASLGSQLNAYNDPNQASYSPFPDGTWHYYAVTVYTDPSNSARYRWKARVDTNTPQVASAVGTPAIRVARLNELFTAVSVVTGNQAGLSVARIAVYNYALSDAQTLAHAQRGLGNINEVTGNRAARLLDTYWGGATDVADGFLEMADDFSYDPTKTTNNSTTSAGQARAVLDGLQEIAESERGLVYAAKDGTTVVEDRESRYGTQTSLATLGEDPTNTGAEYPYSDYSSDFDPTYTFSQANLTSPGNGSWLPMVNSTAKTRYGQRVVSQQLQAVRDFDLEQAGIFYLTRYSGPKTRISKIVLRPSANPALWPLVLGLEISQRYTVKRRSSSGLTVTGDHYVESIEHSIDVEQGDWTVTLQMSPVFVPQAWVLGDSSYGLLGSTTIPIY